VRPFSSSSDSRAPAASAENSASARGLFDGTLARGEVRGRVADDAWLAALLEVFDRHPPDAVVVEGFPLARRAFRFELEPLIAAINKRSPRPRLICSVRDIVVVRNDPDRHRDIVDRIRRDFDAVLVHGDPALISFDASFPAAPAIADRLLYTGYVSPPAPPRLSSPGPAEVIVSAGGGAAGVALLWAALLACKNGCLAGLRWRFLTGVNLPQREFDELHDAAPPNAAVERFHPDLAGLLRHCRVSISQAGYNTVLDILAARAPAVLVPFAAARETEQLTRAERLAARGVVQLVSEQELSPERLAAAVERAAASQPQAIGIDIDGARRSAQLIAALTASPAAAAQDLAKTIDLSIIRE